MIPKVNDLVETYFSSLEKLIKKEGSILKGISSGFKELDFFIDGLQKGHLIVMFGRPSIGKTAFVSTVAQNLAIDQKISTAFFALSQDGEELVQIMISAMSDIERHKLKTGFLNKSEWDQLINLKSKISNAPLYIEDSFFALRDLEKTITILKENNGIEMVIIDSIDRIDFIDLLPIDSRREKRLGICKFLKELAVKLDIPILVTTRCYLSKNRFEDTRYICDLYDFVGDHADIARYADEVFVLDREEYDNPSKLNRGLAEISVFKHKANHCATIPFIFFKNWSMRVEEKCN